MLAGHVASHAACFFSTRAVMYVCMYVELYFRYLQTLTGMLISCQKQRCVGLHRMQTPMPASCCKIRDAKVEGIRGVSWGVCKVQKHWMPSADALEQRRPDSAMSGEQGNELQPSARSAGVQGFRTWGVFRVHRL